MSATPFSSSGDSVDSAEICREWPKIGQKLAEKIMKKFIGSSFRGMNSKLLEPSEDALEGCERSVKIK